MKDAARYSPTHLATGAVACAAAVYVSYEYWRPGFTIWHVERSIESIAGFAVTSAAACGGIMVFWMFSPARRSPA